MSKAKTDLFEISIVADINDADYVTKTSKISNADLEKITPLIKAIKGFKAYTVDVRVGLKWTHDNNYPHGNGEYIPRKDLGEKSPREIYDFPADIFDVFEALLPDSEYGFNTIESIEVTSYLKKVKLL